MVDTDLLKKIEGAQTVDTVSEILGIKRQSAINLLSKLKKEGHAAMSGGGKQKRIYRISTKLQRKEGYEGMFDILNKYSVEKVVPPFYHEPHSRYTVENAIVDLVMLDEIRILVNALKLFNHVRNWALLYTLAKKKGVRKKIGALYDIAKNVIRVRKIPNKTRSLMIKSGDKQNFKRSSNEFNDIEKEWGIKIPFNKKDLEVYKR